ncbi:hypothetical protein Vretimale_13861 [Volvox reticuliferus]|uniref:Copper transporter n=1 Tax=Volvox reticuliferus TaxID=1737510 RepID=A0A8J4LU48_9CHLO|nr:hypothetical protein Vretifemale_14549 [Volvox reticuliferus]GIM10094.1 hypothetical protein Vretimale_13861 [Volvox reticuliferus]
MDMSRKIYLFSSYLVILCASFTAAQTSCPPSPVVLHSTLASVCSQEPARSAIGCSMYRLCRNETLDPPIFPVLCDTWRVASSLCSDDPKYADSIGLCNQLQGSYKDAAQFRNCMVPYVGIKNTSSIRILHLQACAEMDTPSEMLGCLSCTAESCPNPLLSYSQGCYDMDMGQCNPWSGFCLSSDASPLGNGAAELCVNPNLRFEAIMAPPRPPSPPPDPTSPPPTRPSPPPSLPTRSPYLPPPGGSLPNTPVPMNSPASPLPQWTPPPGIRNPSQTESVCVTNSSLLECASFEYPATNITVDLVSLCTSMPYMPGCTIRTACQAGQVTGNFCRPMTLLATICADMPSMAGCKSYVTMCKNTSAVQHCKKFPAIPGLPSTSAARKAVIDMCGSMEMVQCETCNKVSCPDYIGAMSSMCAEMPYMVGCDVYASWCEASAAWEQPGGDGNSVRHYCRGAEVYGGATSSSDIPSMLMFFHQRTREILLFRSWLPKTAGEAFGSFIAITGMSFATVLIRTAQHIMVTAAATGRLGPLLAPTLTPPVLWWLPSRGQMLLNLLSSIITLVVSTLDLFAMLIAMTFNGAYFAAVVLGYGLGTLLLGHLRENYQRKAYGAPSSASSSAIVFGGDTEPCCGGGAIPPTTIIGLGSGGINTGGNAMAVMAANGGIGSFRVSSRQVDVLDGKRP